MSDEASPTVAGAPTAVPGSGLRVSVATTVSMLQAGALAQRGERAQTRARSQLSILRRSAGYTPEKQPIAWQLVLDSLEPPLTDREIGHRDEPSPSESAAFNALTFFALHMQSATGPMHIPRQSFARAVGILRFRRESDSLKARFDAVLAARDDGSRLTHMRNLITLLRTERIGFDYGHFAVDLRTLASAKRHGVLLRWGRDVALSSRSDSVSPDTETSTLTTH